jgi:nucleotide-binding universal stress UspA family protein
MASQILVPLDGSPLAEQALSCAVLKERELIERLDAEANEYLGEVADRVRLAGLSVRPIVRHGPAPEAIVDYAEQMDIWLIIMATHGYSGIKRWTHGSVAERVLQAASVPVLMVRAREEDAEDSRQLMLCRRILVPLDGSEMAEQVLSPVTSVAQAVGAEVFLFQVAVYQPASMFGSDWYFLPAGEFAEEEREAQAYLECVGDPLREEGIQVSTGTQTGPVAESIVQYAEANHIDLMAMCTHGRTGPARWALGSVADRLLRAGGVPVLLVRAR